MTRRRARKNGQRNDHFLSRFQTRPWEHNRKRELLVFDFVTGRFEYKPSLTFFARTGLHTPETGAFLDRVIEKPCSALRQKLFKAKSDADVDKAFNETPHLAIAGLYWYQAQRYEDALAKDEGRGSGAETMDKLAAEGVGGLERLASAIWQDYEPGLLVVPGVPALFFPESVYVPIPVLGENAVLSIPITPNMLLAFVPRSVDHARIVEQLNTPGRMMALSLGISAKVRRVLVPPHIAVPPASMLRDMRVAARDIFNIYGEASQKIGFKGYVAR